MTKQEALDRIREHLTFLGSLHNNPEDYEDGTYELMLALEDVVIPMLKKEIEMELMMAQIFGKDPNEFSRVNQILDKCIYGEAKDENNSEAGQ